MCRDNIYLIPYLYPDSWRGTAGCTSHKQAGAARKAAGWVPCQGDLEGNAGFWIPKEVAELDGGCW